MKAALLALVTTGALLVSTSSADARPPRYHGGYYGGYNNYPRARVYPSYYGGYGSYYPGISLGFGNFGPSIGNSYAYPYSYGNYYRGYYPRSYYGNRYYGNRYY